MMYEGEGGGMNGDLTSPYKGLSAFEDSELDALLFFGRERENEIVVANLIASRLTVLYGPSGVGKSSLLSAAVARSLRALPEEPLVVVFSRWSEDPEAALADAVAEAGGGRNGSALSALEGAQTDRDVYLVLDQAEEYFLYHADESGAGTFADALPTLLSAPYRVNVLVSMREDSLAKLDRFTGRIPGLFANTLRLDRLDRDAARAAIVRPVERFNELTGSAVAVEPGLVERVLQEVGAGQIEPALGGLGAVDDRTTSDARIEAPYLQVVMQRLWEEERDAGSDMLRMETLERLGGAQRIVEEHLQGAMEELSPEQQDVAARLFNHLVTPSGTKIAHELPDLVDFGHVPLEEVAPVLSTLSERRILRSFEENGGARYEIFHDVLADPVLAWRRSHEADSELAHQREEADRRHRRLLGVIAVGSVLLAAMGAVTLYALSQRSEARTQTLAAQARELEALADAELGRDPELSVLLALEAVRMAPGPSAEDALREALLQSRVQRVVSVDEPLVGAKASGRDVIAVTSDGDVVVGRSGSSERRITTGVAAADASFADDGTVLVTGRDGLVRVVRRDGSVTTTPDVGDASGAAMSPDGSLAAVVHRGDVRLVDVASGRVLETYRHPGAISAAISPDNRRVLTGGEDDMVHVWSGQSGRRVHTLTEHTGNAAAVEFSTDGRYVASASTDGSGRVWRTADWGLQSTLGGHIIALTDVDFSADGEHVVTSSRDGTARTFKTDAGTPLVVLTGNEDWVTSAAFTGEAGSSVVTASRDGTARIWNASFQPEVESLAALPGPVSSIRVDRRGRIRAVAGDGRTHLLDMSGNERGAAAAKADPSGTVVGPDGTTATIRRNTVVLERPDGRRSRLTGHRAVVYSAAFSDDGSLLATASRDHDVRVWNVATGHPVGPPLQGNSEVRDAQFSPDGRWVVTAANRAGLFDTRSGALVARLQGHEAPLTAVAFGPNGRTIVTGAEDGTLGRYVCQVCGGRDALVELAERRLAATGRELTEEERERYLG